MCTTDLATATARRQRMRNAMRVFVFCMFVAVCCPARRKVVMRPGNMATEPIDLAEDDRGIHRWAFFLCRRYGCPGPDVAARALVICDLTRAAPREKRSAVCRSAARSHNVARALSTGSVEVLFCRGRQRAWGGWFGEPIRYPPCYRVCGKPKHSSRSSVYLVVCLTAQGNVAVNRVVISLSMEIEA